MDVQHRICSACNRIVRAGIRCVCGALIVSAALVGHGSGPHVPREPYQPAPQIIVVVDQRGHVLDGSLFVPVHDFSTTPALIARSKPRRRHPAYDTWSGSDAPIFWYAAEQAKKAAAASFVASDFVIRPFPAIA